MKAKPKPGVGRDLWGASAASAVVRAASVAAGLAVSVVLARALGPGGYGVYAYAFAIVGVLSVPAQFGLPNLMVRETARAQAQDRLGVLRGLWRFASGFVLAACALLAAAVAGIFYLWQPAGLDAASWVVLFAALLTLLMALSNVWSGALRGLHHTVLGQVPELVLRQALTALFVLASVYLLGRQLTAETALGLHVAAAAVACALAGLALRAKARPALEGAPAPQFAPRAWLMGAWPIALTSGLQLANGKLDIVFLGWFAPSEEVGLYRVALQAALLTTLGLQTVNMVVAPRFARLHQQGDREQLQRIVTFAARGALAAAAPVAVVLALYGGSIMGVVFGDAFAAAEPLLAVLLIGVMGSVVFGSVGFLLTMTGHERQAAIGAGVGSLVNLSLNLLLVPAYGALGAAMATTAGYLTWNVLLAVEVYRWLRLDSTVLGRRPR